MQDLAIRLWPTLAAAALLGLVLCATGRRGRPGLALRHWVGPGLAMFAILVGAALAYLGRPGGLAGLWLESALCHAVSYLAGCGLGYALRLALRRESAGAGGAEAPG